MHSRSITDYSVSCQSQLIMTSYIPSLTLPSQVFAQPAASILLPVALGTAVGFSMQRM